MAKSIRPEILDRFVEAAVTDRFVYLSPDEIAGPARKQMEAVAEVVVGLTGLPRADFRARLKANLERSAAMSTAPGKAVSYIREGFHSITPYLIIPNAAQLIGFLKTAFGAEERFRVNRPGTETIMHAELKIGDSMIELADANPQVPPTPASM